MYDSKSTKILLVLTYSVVMYCIVRWLILFRGYFRRIYLLLMTFNLLVEFLTVTKDFDLEFDFECEFNPPSVINIKAESGSFRKEKRNMLARAIIFPTEKKR